MCAVLWLRCSSCGTKLVGDAPRRIQLRRTPGWRLPPDTVVCTRPRALGNPFSAQHFGHAQAVAMHEIWLREPNAAALGYAPPLADKLDALRAEVLRQLPALRGRNLACWCRLPAPGARDLCHAATLLQLANAPLRCDLPTPFDTTWS